MTPTHFIKLRKRLGLSQAQLAEQLGVNRTTITKWENGRHPIPLWAQKAMEGKR